MSVEIRYFEGDENAQKNMSLASFAQLDNTGSDYANTDFIQNGAPDIPYATLEDGVWKLNGTRKTLSEEEKFFICGKIGHSLKVEISFSETITPANLSLSFSPSSDQWPYKVEIYVVHVGGVQEIFDVYPDGPELHFRYYDETFDDVNNSCNGFVIWLYPKTDQRVKIRKITAGIETIFGDRELSNVNLVTEFDPSLSSLPSDMLSFNIRGSGTKNFISREGNKVELYKNGKLEHTMWIKEIERISQDQYSINCQSLIGTLDQKYYGKIMSPGGEIYGPYRDNNAWSYAEYVIDRISQFGSRFQVNYTSSAAKDRAGTTLLIGYIPVCAEKEALRQVLFACGLATSTTDGKLNIAQINTDITYEFTDKDITSIGKAKRMKPVGVIEVYRIYEKYIEQAWKVDTEYKGIVETQRIAHFLEKPSGDTQGEGFEYGAGWHRATDESLAGGVILNHYIEFERVPETQKVAGNENYSAKLTIENCTLIHDATGYSTAPDGYTDSWGEIVRSDVLENVFSRMHKYAQYRVLVEQDVVVTDQHAGDYVRTLTPWGTTVEGWIISMDSTITQNGHRARIKVLGKEVS